MPTERIRFHPARLWKLFLPIAALAAISVAVDPDKWRHAPRWVYAVLAGAGAFLVAGHFLLQRYYYLELSDAGLTIATLGGHRFFPWHQIEGAGAAEREIDTVARADVVLLRLHEASLLSQMTRSVTGGNISLLAVYELPPAEIARLIRARLTSVRPASASRTGR